jgi:hypothetical protein
VEWNHLYSGRNNHYQKRLPLLIQIAKEEDYYLPLKEQLARVIRTAKMH